MVVHIERQRQAVGLEGAGEEVEVGEQGFGGIESRAGVEAGGVVEDFEEDLLVGSTGQPSVGRGVVLPEGAVIAGCRVTFKRRLLRANKRRQGF